MKTSRFSTRRQFSTALAVACTMGAPWSARGQTKPTTLTFAHSAAPDNPRHLAAAYFSTLLNKSTEGRLEVVVSPSSTLADDDAAIAGLVKGSIDFTANSQGPVAKVVPEFACLGLPYVFSTQEQVWRVLAGPMGDRLRAECEVKGLVALGFWDNGFRQITNSKRPIHEPADLKGLKIRTPSDAATMDFIKAMGAEPVVVKFSELIAALKEGRVDGQENPLVNIYTSHIEQAQKFLTLTDHKYETTPLLVSKITWARLSAPDRAAIKEAAAQATYMQRQLMLKADERSFRRIESSGIEITNINKALFAKASQQVLEQWSKGPTGQFSQLLVAAAKSAALPGT